MRCLSLLPRFRQAYQSVELLAEREQWSQTQIRDYQLHKLNCLWRHAIGHVPFYRQLRQQRDLPGQFSSLAEFTQTVPLLTKSTVRDHPELFLSDHPQPGWWE